jgi:prepilin-type N-terminal cleavage/methylation domain-containing protein
MKGYRPGGRRCPANRTGVTLIELMVTIVLLAVGLVGVSSMFIVGYRNQTHAHFASVASDIANRKVERLRSAGYNAINNTNFPSPFAVPELPSGQGTITWEPYPDPTSSNQLVATITVNWGGGNGIEGAVALCAVISNHG